MLVLHHLHLGFANFAHHIDHIDDKMDVDGDGSGRSEMNDV